MFFLGLLLGTIAYYYLAKFVYKRVTSIYAGKVAKYLTIAVFVLIPIWDIIPGHLYFRYLCKTEGGVEVYKTVQADKAYFLANGQPDQEKLSGIYDRPRKVDRDFSSIFHITKSQFSIIDKQTGDRLGTATDFWYYGGWLNATLFPQGSSSTCPEYPNHSVSSSLWEQVIRPKADPTAGGK